jgi:hypothetical protein
MKAVQQRLQNIPSAVMRRPSPNGAMALYGLFQDIIEKDEKRIDELVRIVQIIFCARRPLQPRELYVLLDQEYNNPFDPVEAPDEFIKKRVLEISKGLAEVTKSAMPTVQFIHETVTEFLRDGGLKSISKQSVDRDGHEAMKASCLKQIRAPVAEHLELLLDYRCRGDYRNILVHDITQKRQKEFEEQANQKFPFLKYASKNLFVHADEAEAMGVSQIEFLESFPAFVEGWIPVYNLFQRFNTRRYSKQGTTLLYILSDHGCTNLIKSSAKLRQDYARNVKGNEFASPLICAIYNGHLGTAWSLVGLEATCRTQTIAAPPRSHHRYGESLIRVLGRLGDVHLMRKVLQDQYAASRLIELSDFLSCIEAEELVDVFCEVSQSSVPESPSSAYSHNQLQAGQVAQCPLHTNADLVFVRRAIRKDQTMFDLKISETSTMFAFAFNRRWQRLLSLFLEYSPNGQSALDSCLRRAAKDGDINSVKFAHRFNANLESRDEDGRSALHLAVAYYRHDDILGYLLSKKPSCVDARDHKGETALGIAIRASIPANIYERVRSRIRATLLEAGADVNVTTRCICSPREEHQVPLLVMAAINRSSDDFLALASDDRCNLDARDSFGRTALSWCITHLHGSSIFGSEGISGGMFAEAVGPTLLQNPAVDVNSRDNLGRTILEHFIRDPAISSTSYKAFVCDFFRCERLDPNLQTSNNQHPLELIISLHETSPFLDKPVRSPTEDIVQEVLNKRFIWALGLLLGTGKVDIVVQRRCLGNAAPELRSIISDYLP